MKSTLKKIANYSLTLACLAGINLTIAPVAKLAAQSGNIIATINFDPKTDGFGFENYDNKTRQWQSDLTAEDMVRFFGAKAVCKTGDSASNCVLNAAAGEWMLKQLQGMNGGHCEGMATAAVRLKFAKPFKTIDGKASSFQPAASRAYDLKLDQILGNYIAYYFITQAFNEVAAPTQETAKKGPVSVVTTLAEAMKSGAETYTLGFYKYNRATGKKSEGHAITPIAVEDAGDIYRIHVYDNNYPGETRYVNVEKEGKQTWKYVTSTNPSEPAAEYTGDIDTKTLELTPTSAREKNCYEAPFAGDAAEKQCAGASASVFGKSALNTKFFSGADEFFTINNDQSPVPATVADVAGDRAEFFLNNDGDLLVTTPDGKRLGFDPETNKFYEEINGGIARSILGGRGKTVPNYSIPAQTSGGAYKVVFSGKDLEAESTTDFTYSAPGLTVGFDGIQLDPNETLATTITPDGETITFTSSADGETPGIYFAFDPQDGSGASYLVRVSGAEIEAGKTLTAHFDFDKHTVSFKDNDGNSDTYNVEVEKINADGTRQTLKKELKEENGEVGGNLDDWSN